MRILEIFRGHFTIDFNVKHLFSELKPIRDLPSHIIYFRTLRYTIPVVKDILLNNLDKSSIDSVIKLLTDELENFDVVITSLSENDEYETDAEWLLNKITTDVKIAYFSGFEFMIEWLG
ncbi:Hypothetical protein CINCED_3A015561 [Cinara cedri]|uniref:Uncharacterized protein n=1 Tax=Cinara cedri TaxID=506608 RepID=A0A5E4MPK7_9HEMI|nr:Hypothetical protein CINCED_3A015561 [Cinara cedri]